MCSLMKNLSEGTTKGGRLNPEKRFPAEEKRSFALATPCMRLLQQFFQFIDFPFAGLKGMIYEYWLRWHGPADYVTKRSKFYYVWP